MSYNCVLVVHVDPVVRDQKCDTFYDLYYPFVIEADAKDFAASIPPTTPDGVHSIPFVMIPEKAALIPPDTNLFTVEMNLDDKYQLSLAVKGPFPEGKKYDDSEGMKIQSQESPWA